MRYIDVRPLLERIIKLEAVALEEASKYATTDDSVRWNRWAAILGERTAFKYDLMDAPTVDVEPVRHGHWTNYKDEHTCSVCHATVCEETLDGEWGSQGIYDYCPYCGAKMGEERKED